MDDVKQHIDKNARAEYIDWLRGDRPPPDERILEHVGACFDCKQEILELADILDALDKDEQSKKVRLINLKVVLRAVAVLAGVMAVALIIQFLKPKDDSVELAGTDKEIIKSANPSEAVLNDSSPALEIIPANEVVIIKHDTILYAANYKANPGLETLVKARFRSLEESIFDREQISEQLKIGEILNVDFTGLLGDDIEFVLMSNTGKNLKVIKLDDKKMQLVLNYEPGLYYWKIIISDELFMLGKFKLFS